jgi:hypothetical protein
METAGNQMINEENTYQSKALGGNLPAGSISL